jgi:triosephosphate isomerase
MRRTIIAGNWKMNMDLGDGPALAGEIVSRVESIDLPGHVDVVLCPPFVLLHGVAGRLEGSRLQLGAQTMHYKPSGAFTGEISAPMLLSVGCSYVILGHSERRTIFKESDQDVGLRVRVAIESGLIPIICVGETLEERDAGELHAVIDRQVRAAFDGLGEEGARRSVIAYEPVWAIGTGRTATPAQAQEVHYFLRTTIAGLYSEDVASMMPILYGGSVKGSNAAELFNEPDIDGGLIGGASLDAEDFLKIVEAARG